MLTSIYLSVDRGAIMVASAICNMILLLIIGIGLSFNNKLISFIFITLFLIKSLIEAILNPSQWISSIFIGILLIIYYLSIYLIKNNTCNHFKSV